MGRPPPFSAQLGSCPGPHRLCPCARTQPGAEPGCHVAGGVWRRPPGGAPAGPMAPLSGQVATLSTPSCPFAFPPFTLLYLAYTAATAPPVPASRHHQRCTPPPPYLFSIRLVHRNVLPSSSLSTRSSPLRSWVRVNSTNSSVVCHGRSSAPRGLRPPRLLLLLLLRVFCNRTDQIIRAQVQK
jgi:hypothetical protein